MASDFVFDPSAWEPVKAEPAETPTTETATEVAEPAEFSSWLTPVPANLRQDVRRVNLLGVKSIADSDLRKLDGGADLLRILDLDSKRNRGFMEAFTDVRAADFPFVGDIVGVAVPIRELKRITTTFKRLEAGEKVDDQDLVYAQLFLADQQRRSMATTGGMIGEVVRAMPFFAAEIGAYTALGAMAGTALGLAPGAVAGGVAGAVAGTGKAAVKGGAFVARKLLGKAANEAAEKAASKFVVTIAGRRVLRAAGRELVKAGVIGTGMEAVDTAINAAVNVARGEDPLASRGGYERHIGAYLSGDDTSLQEAQMMALGDRWIEYVSEASGGVFGELLFQGKGSNAAFVKAYDYVFGKGRADQIAKKAAAWTGLKLIANRMGRDGDLGAMFKAIKAVGYDGYAEEILEERFGDFFRGLTGLEGDEASLKNAFHNATPNKQKLLVEATAFAIPVAGVLAAHRGHMALAGITKSEYEKHMESFLRATHGAASRHVESVGDVIKDDRGLEMPTVRQAVEDLEYFAEIEQKRPDHPLARIANAGLTLLESIVTGKLAAHPNYTNVDQIMLRHGRDMFVGNYKNVYAGVVGTLRATTKLSDAEIEAEAKKKTRTIMTQAVARARKTLAIDDDIYKAAGIEARTGVSQEEIVKALEASTQGEKPALRRIPVGQAADQHNLWVRTDDGHPLYDGLQNLQRAMDETLLRHGVSRRRLIRTSEQIGAGLQKEDFTGYEVTEDELDNVIQNPMDIVGSTLSGVSGFDISRPGGVDRLRRFARFHKTLLQNGVHGRVYERANQDGTTHSRIRVDRLADGRFIATPAPVGTGTKEVRDAAFLRSRAAAQELNQLFGNETDTRIADTALTQHGFVHDATAPRSIRFVYEHMVSSLDPAVVAKIYGRNIATDTPQGVKEAERTVLRDLHGIKTEDGYWNVGASNFNDETGVIVAASANTYHTWEEIAERRLRLANVKDRLSAYNFDSDVDTFVAQAAQIVNRKIEELKDAKAPLGGWQSLRDMLTQGTTDAPVKLFGMLMLGVNEHFELIGEQLPFAEQIEDIRDELQQLVEFNQFVERMSKTLGILNPAGKINKAEAAWQVNQYLTPDEAQAKIENLIRVAGTRVVSEAPQDVAPTPEELGNYEDGQGVSVAPKVDKSAKGEKSVAPAKTDKVEKAPSPAPTTPPRKDGAQAQAAQEPEGDEAQKLAEEASEELRKTPVEGEPEPEVVEAVVKNLPTTERLEEARKDPNRMMAVKVGKAPQDQKDLKDFFTKPATTPSVAAIVTDIPPPPFDAVWRMTGDLATPPEAHKQKFMETLRPYVQAIPDDGTRDKFIMEVKEFLEFAMSSIPIAQLPFVQRLVGDKISLDALLGLPVASPESSDEATETLEEQAADQNDTDVEDPFSDAEQQQMREADERTLHDLRKLGALAKTLEKLTGSDGYNTLYRVTHDPKSLESVLGAVVNNDALLQWLNTTREGETADESALKALIRVANVRAQEIQGEDAIGLPADYLADVVESIRTKVQRQSGELVLSSDGKVSLVILNRLSVAEHIQASAKKRLRTFQDRSLEYGDRLARDFNAVMSITRPNGTLYYDLFEGNADRARMRAAISDRSHFRDQLFKFLSAWTGAPVGFFESAARTGDGLRSIADMVSINVYYWFGDKSANKSNVGSRSFKDSQDDVRRSVLLRAMNDTWLGVAGLPGYKKSADALPNHEKLLRTGNLPKFGLAAVYRDSNLKTQAGWGEGTKFTNGVSEFLRQIGVTESIEDGGMISISNVVTEDGYRSVSFKDLTEHEVELIEMKMYLNGYMYPGVYGDKTNTQFVKIQRLAPAVAASKYREFYSSTTNLLIEQATWVDPDEVDRMVEQFRELTAKGNQVTDDEKKLRQDLHREVNRIYYVTLFDHIVDGSPRFFAAGDVPEELRKSVAENGGSLTAAQREAYKKPAVQLLDNRFKRRGNDLTGGRNLRTIESHLKAVTGRQDGKVRVLVLNNKQWSKNTDGMFVYRASTLGKAYVKSQGSAFSGNIETANTIKLQISHVTEAEAGVRVPYLDKMNGVAVEQLTAERPLMQAVHAMMNAADVDVVVFDSSEKAPSSAAYRLGFARDDRLAVKTAEELQAADTVAKVASIVRKVDGENFIVPQMLHGKTKPRERRFAKQLQNIMVSSPNGDLYRQLIEEYVDQVSRNVNTKSFKFLTKVAIKQLRRGDHPELAVALEKGIRTIVSPDIRNRINLLSSVTKMMQFPLLRMRGPLVMPVDGISDRMRIPNPRSPGKHIGLVNANIDSPEHFQAQELAGDTIEAAQASFQELFAAKYKEWNKVDASEDRYRYENADRLVPFEYAFERSRDTREAEDNEWASIVVDGKRVITAGSPLIRFTSDGRIDPACLRKEVIRQRGDKFVLLGSLVLGDRIPGDGFQSAGPAYIDHGFADKNLNLVEQDAEFIGNAGVDGDGDSPDLWLTGARFDNTPEGIRNRFLALMIDDYLSDPGLLAWGKQSIVPVTDLVKSVGQKLKFGDNAPIKPVSVSNSHARMMYELQVGQVKDSVALAAKSNTSLRRMMSLGGYFEKPIHITNGVQDFVLSHSEADARAILEPNSDAWNRFNLALHVSTQMAVSRAVDDVKELVQGHMKLRDWRLTIEMMATAFNEAILHPNTAEPFDYAKELPAAAAISEAVTTMVARSRYLDAVDEALVRGTERLERGYEPKYVRQAMMKVAAEARFHTKEEEAALSAFKTKLKAEGVSDYEMFRAVNGFIVNRTNVGAWVRMRDLSESLRELGLIADTLVGDPNVRTLNKITQIQTALGNIRDEGDPGLGSLKFLFPERARAGAVLMSKVTEALPTVYPSATVAGKALESLTDSEPNLDKKSIQPQRVDAAFNAIQTQLALRMMIDDSGLRGLDPVFTATRMASLRDAFPNNTFFNLVSRSGLFEDALELLPVYSGVHAIPLSDAKIAQARGDFDLLPRQLQLEIALAAFSTFDFGSSQRHSSFTMLMGDPEASEFLRDLATFERKAYTEFDTANPALSAVVLASLTEPNFYLTRSKLASVILGTSYVHRPTAFAERQKQILDTQSGSQQEADTTGADQVDMDDFSNRRRSRVSLQQFIDRKFPVASDEEKSLESRTRAWVEARGIGLPGWIAQVTETETGTESPVVVVNAELDRQAKALRAKVDKYLRAVQPGAASEETPAEGTAEIAGAAEDIVSKRLNGSAGNLVPESERQRTIAEVVPKVTNPSLKKKVLKSLSDLSDLSAPTPSVQAVDVSPDGFVTLTFSWQLSSIPERVRKQQTLEQQLKRVNAPKDEAAAFLTWAKGRIGDSVSLQQQYETEVLPKLEIKENRSPVYEGLSVNKERGTYKEYFIETPFPVPGQHGSFQDANLAGWFRVRVYTGAERTSIGRVPLDRQLRLSGIYDEYLRAWDTNEDAEGEPLEYDAWVKKNFPEDTRKTSAFDESGILEVHEIQSELFQKNKGGFTHDPRIRPDGVSEGLADEVDFDEDQRPVFVATGERVYSPPTVEAATFLNLMLKDQTWVPVFVNAITQWAKNQGFTKVRFPTGETAAKVEGHQVLADKIKQLQEERAAATNQGLPKDWFVLEQKGQWVVYDREGEAQNAADTREQAIAGAIDFADRSLPGKSRRTLQEIDAEINEIKTQGIEKLAPIEAFYEKRVASIVNKLGAVPMTDASNNTWREVSLTAAPTPSVQAVEPYKAPMAERAPTAKQLTNWLARSSANKMADRNYDVNYMYKRIRAVWDPYLRHYETAICYEEALQELDHVPVTLLGMNKKHKERMRQWALLHLPTVNTLLELDHNTLSHDTSPYYDDVMLDHPEISDPDYKPGQLTASVMSVVSNFEDVLSPLRGAGAIGLQKLLIEETNFSAATLSHEKRVYADLVSLWGLDGLIRKYREYEFRYDDKGNRIKKGEPGVKVTGEALWSHVGAEKLTEDEHKLVRLVHSAAYAKLETMMSYNPKPRARNLVILGLPADATLETMLKVLPKAVAERLVERRDAVVARLPSLIAGATEAQKQALDRQRVVALANAGLILYQRIPQFVGDPAFDVTSTEHWIPGETSMVLPEAEVAAELAKSTLKQRLIEAKRDPAKLTIDALAKTVQAELNQLAVVLPSRMPWLLSDDAIQMSFRDKSSPHFYGPGFLGARERELHLILEKMLKAVDKARETPYHGDFVESKTPEVEKLPLSKVPEQLLRYMFALKGLGFPATRDQLMRNIAEGVYESLDITPQLTYGDVVRNIHADLRQQLSMRQVRGDNVEAPLGPIRDPLALVKIAGRLGESFANKRTRAQLRPRVHETFEASFIRTGKRPDNLGVADVMHRYTANVLLAVRTKILMNQMSLVSDAEGTPLVIPEPDLAIEGSNGELLSRETWAAAAGRLAEYFNDKLDAKLSDKENISQLIRKHVAGNRNYTRVEAPYATIPAFYAFKRDLGRENLLDTLLAGGEVSGILKHVFGKPWQDPYGILKGLEHVNLWMKMQALQLSLFFPIAGQEGLLAVFGKKYFVGSGGPLAQVDFRRMVKSGHPYVMDLISKAEALGIQFSTSDADPMGLPHGMMEQDIAKLSDFVEANFSTDVANGIRALGRVAKFQTNFMFESYYNTVKLWTVHLFAQQLQQAKEAKGETFDFERDMRPYTEYINSEVGGVNWNRISWMTPSWKRNFQLFMFSPDWSQSAWDAAGGGVITGSLLKSYLTPEEAKFILHKRWPNMFLWVMLMAPAMVQATAYAVAKALGTVQPDDEWLIFNNEAGRKLHADLTPLLRAAPWYKGAPTGERRTYIRWGKQAYETQRWLESPWNSLMNKSSQLARWAIEMATGTSSGGQQWALPFKDQGLLGWIQDKDGNFMGSRLGYTVKKFMPFSILAMAQASDAAPLQILGPVSKGASFYSVTQAYMGLLDTWARSTTYSKFYQNDRVKVNLDNLGRDILDAAERNGYDPKKVIDSARGAIIKDLYAGLYKAINSGNQREIERWARMIMRLNGTVQSTLRSVKNRNAMYGVPDKLTKEQQAMIKEAFDRP